jgi:ubiquitin carboxyl-terminal hydrolase 5/13
MVSSPVAILQNKVAPLLNFATYASPIYSPVIRSIWLTISVTVHPDGSKEEFQNGISPRMLKALIGQGHAEFAGTKQQDAQEFLIWLLSRIHRTGKPTGTVAERLVLQESEHTSPGLGNIEETLMKDVGDGARETGLGWGGIVDPTNVFRFVVQQRIQCLGCGGVKYRVDQVDNINISVPDRLKTCLPRPHLHPQCHNSQTRFPSTFKGLTNRISTSETDVGDSDKADYEPVEFEDCIKTYTAKAEIDLVCSHCQHPRATMANGFLTLPDVLVVTASRFVLKNWVPTKLGNLHSSLFPEFEPYFV